MILNDFALLLANTKRSKAYLQMMVRNDLLPSLCVCFGDDVEAMLNETRGAGPAGDPVASEYFDVNEPVIETIRRNGLKYIAVNSKDINSPEMVRTTGGLSQKYVVYSGYGGAILKSPILHQGKKIVHVHAGILPDYRGSTTAYYSYLREGCFGATAIFFNEGIDEGEIIAQKTFPNPATAVDVDYVYEPYTRSQVLKMVLESYVKTGGLESRRQDASDGETYYIIHPVLKHLALMKMERDRRR